MSEPFTERAGSALRWSTIRQVGVKAIYLIRIPILARLLAPEDFGLMAIALVAVDVMLSLTDMGMMPALVQRDELAEEHYESAWSVGLSRALLVSAGVFLGAPVVATIFEEPRSVPIIQALALRPLLDALASMRVADLTRALEFRSLALLKLSGAALNAGTSIALAPFIGVWSLVAGALAGPAIYAVLSYVFAPFRPRFRLDREAASSLIRFGRWIFVLGLIGLVSRFVLQAVISRRLGTVDLGLYYLAARIAYLPSEVSADMIGSVAFPLYAKLQDDLERARQAFAALFTGTMALLIPLTVLLLALAPSLVNDLFGPRWAGAEAAIQVLCVVTMIELFGDALTPAFNGMGRPSAVAVLAGIQTVVLVSLVGELADRFGLPGAVAAWIPATAAAQIVGFFVLRRVIPNAYRGLGRPILSILVISFAGALVAHGIDRALPGVLGLVVAGGVGAWLTAAALLRADRHLALGVADSLIQFQPELASLLARIGGRAPKGGPA